MEGSAAFSGQNPYLAPVLLDYTVRDGKAQSSALASRFGSDERVEYPVQDIRRYAGPGVPYHELRASSAFRFDGAGADREHASAGHGVPGVRDEVYYRLFEPVRVAEDAGDLSKLHHGLDEVRMEHLAEYQERVADDLVQVDCLQFRRLDPGEYAQVLYHRLHLLRGFRDEVHLLVLLGPLVEGAQHPLREAADDRQGLAHFVSEACRELAEGRHLARLDELHLRLPHLLGRAPPP